MNIETENKNEFSVRPSEQSKKWLIVCYSLFGLCQIRVTVHQRVLIVLLCYVILDCAGVGVGVDMLISACGSSTAILFVCASLE
jgi:hypothetical protein